MKDLQKMSNAELENLSKQIEKERSERESEEKRKSDLKEKYALKEPEITFTFLPDKFHKEVMRLGKSDSKLMEQLKEIEKNCQHKNRPLEKDIYPCPICGQMMLRPGNFGDTYCRKYRIMCSECDFVAPVKEQSAEYAAWQEFHEWLVREGYLKT